MAIADFQTLMRPMLEVQADGSPRSQAEIRDLVAVMLGVTEADRKELLPSGKQPTYTNRIAWAGTHLAPASLLRRPARGISQITDRGRQVLLDHPDRVDLRVLAGFRSMPSSAIARAIESARLPRPRPAPAPAPPCGLDGLIKLDPLGLDVIYVQAKRYTDKVIGRPDVQGFVGALQGTQASRGIFITTSRFTPDATQFADRVNVQLVLIDGPELAGALRVDGNLNAGGNAAVNDVSCSFARHGQCHRQHRRQPHRDRQHQHRHRPARLRHHDRRRPRRMHRDRRKAAPWGLPPDCRLQRRPHLQLISRDAENAYRDPEPTATALTLSAAKVKAGHEQAEHLTVRVKPRTGGIPPGRVTLTAGNVTLCVITLKNAKRTCTLTASKLRPGTYHLIAAYPGSTAYAGSASPSKTLTVTN